MLEEKLPVPITRWFGEITKTGETSLVPKTFQKILLDLQRNQASLGKAPNYFSGIVMEGSEKYYRVNRSYSVGLGVRGESLIIFTDLERTEKDGLTTYSPQGLNEEITSFHTEIYFLLPKDRLFEGNNENLINWARWFLKTPEKTIIMAWGKLRLNYGASINETFLHLLSPEQLVSLKDFLVGYLAANKVNPTFIKDLRESFVKKGDQERLEIENVLNDLYTLAIALK